MTNPKRHIEVVDVALELAYIPFAKASKTYIKQSRDSTEDSWAINQLDAVDAVVPKLGGRNYELHDHRRNSTDFLSHHVGTISADGSSSTTSMPNMALTVDITSKKLSYRSELLTATTLRNGDVSGFVHEPQSLSIRGKKLRAISKSSSLNLKYAKMKNDMKRLSQSSSPQMIWPDKYLDTSSATSYSPLFAYSLPSCPQVPQVYESSGFMDSGVFAAPHTINDFYETSDPLGQRSVDHDILSMLQLTSASGGLSSNEAYDSVVQPIESTLSLSKMSPNYNASGLQYPPLLPKPGVCELESINGEGDSNQMPFDNDNCRNQFRSASIGDFQYDYQYPVHGLSGLQNGSELADPLSIFNGIPGSLPDHPPVYLESKSGDVDQPTSQEHQYLILKNLLENEAVEHEKEPKRNHLFEKIQKVGSEIRASASASIPCFSPRNVTPYDKQQEWEKRLMRQKSRFQSLPQSQSLVNRTLTGQANSPQVKTSISEQSSVTMISSDEATMTRGQETLPTQLLLSRPFTPLGNTCILGKAQSGTEILPKSKAELGINIGQLIGLEQDFQGLAKM
ncbi:hypothetical protein BGZ76_011736 [Entomortierella beljakovae]|nr:hypothetical protein BGZ76_011736 [Entomortierella beljakovae]